MLVKTRTHPIGAGAQVISSTGHPRRLYSHSVSVWRLRQLHATLASQVRRTATRGCPVLQHSQTRRWQNQRGSFLRYGTYSCSNQNWSKNWIPPLPARCGGHGEGRAGGSGHARIMNNNWRSLVALMRALSLITVRGNGVGGDWMNGRGLN